MRVNTNRILIISVFFLMMTIISSGMAFTSPAAAAGMAVPDGTYKGAIDIPAYEIVIVVHFTTGDDGTRAGTIDMPDQAVEGWETVNLSIEEDGSVFFIMEIPGNEAAFEGTYDDETKSITGGFFQNDMEFPFTLALYDPEAEIAAVAAKLDGLDEWIDTNLAAWDVPGMSIGVVYNDRVIFADGFGIRDIDKQLPVTTDTLFAIGSTTKAFTTTLMAMLAQDGVLDWDTPVKDYIPELKLWDDYITNNINPVDLVTHRTGLPRHDLIWIGGSLSRDELFANLHHLEANEGFREKFQYNNLMYMVAGILMERITGKSWEALISERILVPLGMDATVLTDPEMEASDDFALSYQDDFENGAWVLIDGDEMDATVIAPAGSINSNLNDMLKWVRFQLGYGAFDGEDLLSAQAVAGMWRPYMHMGAPAMGLEVFPLQSYGLGWFLIPYEGYEIVMHSGNRGAFSAQVFMVPAKKIGIVALTNKAATNLPLAASFHITNLLLDKDESELNELLLLSQTQIKQLAGSGMMVDQLEANRIADTEPSHPLEDYTGRFAHPAYGEITIRLSDDGLLQLLRGDEIEGLVHYHYETFRRDADPEFMYPSYTEQPGYKITFVTDIKGKVSSLKSVIEPTVDAIVFERQADNPLVDPDYVANVVGKYRLEMGVDAYVELLDESTLVFKVSGQPNIEYVPSPGGLFEAPDYPESYIRFEIDPDGGPTKIVLIQSNSEMSGERVE